MSEPLLFAKTWNKCQKCPLHKTRTQVVLGVGHPRADVFIIGPSPDQYADRHGAPFTGIMGGILEEGLAEVGWDRENVYLDNVVACWPKKKINTKVETRNPTATEIKMCYPRVQEAIYRVDPKIIITLGAVATKTVTGSTASLDKMRGDIYFPKIPGFYKHVTYPVFATFNLERVAKYPNKKNKNSPKYQFLEDFRRVDMLVRKVKELYGEVYDV
ncbi:MAG: uracil-DNA glycosylase [Candidatus Hodarchaeales archaeon]|jgi:uracil-DNA glycosylase family 4